MRGSHLGRNRYGDLRLIGTYCVRILADGLRREGSFEAVAGADDVWEGHAGGVACETGFSQYSANVVERTVLNTHVFAVQVVELGACFMRAEDMEEESEISTELPARAVASFGTVDVLGALSKALFAEMVDEGKAV